MFRTILALSFICFMPVILAQSIPTHRLLFVGNSLTYTHDLPRLVETAATVRGMHIETTMLAKPGYAIVDHWADGVVQGLISSGNYDFVIIQQGPSSQQDGYQMLVNAGRQYSDLAQAHGAKLAYFMVWPSRQYYHTFAGVIANYTAGAQANDAILCPVGQVWKDHFDATGDFSYYGADNFHPSRQGSQVAAEVILDSLFAGDEPAVEYRQAWLTGVGIITDQHIQVSDVYLTEGGAFGDAFNPQDINKTPWGSLTIAFSSCHQASVNWSSNVVVNDSPFGSGSYPIQRLAMNHAASLCDDSNFSELTSHAYFSGSYSGGPDRDGEGFHIDYLNADQALVTWYTYLPAQ
jgi:hypothetical protein